MEGERANAPKGPAHSSYRSKIIRSLVMANVIVSSLILLTLVIWRPWGSALVMGLHLLLMGALLIRLVVAGPGDATVAAICLVNLITWPLLQEFTGGIQGSGGVMVWMFLSPLTASFAYSRPKVNAIFLVCMAVMVIGVLLEDHPLPWRPEVTTFSSLLFLLNIIGVSSICHVSITAFYDHIHELRKRMTLQTEDIQSSIRYAKNIQEASLPSRTLLSSSLGDVLLFYSPKDIVSGDFYWVAEKDGTIIVAVADCTGHGVPGGFMTMLGINSLNNIVLEKGVTDPCLILHYLHWCIREPFNRSEAQISDGMDISICAIDRAASTVVHSGARSTLFHVNGSLHTYTSTRCSVGGADRDLSFKNITIKSKPGDRFYLFSDGFTDQFGGPRDKRFGRTRMKELIERIAHEDLSRQQMLVQKEFHAWKGERDQLDDVLLLGFTIDRPAQPTGSMATEPKLFTPPPPTYERNEQDHIGDRA